MRHGELDGLDQADLQGDTGHLVWAAQATPEGRPGPGVRIRRRGTATAVASPALSGRDRIAVAGRPADAVPLVREVLAEVGPTYRPFGDAELIDALIREIDGLEPGGAPFHWMETRTAPEPVHAPGLRLGWLDAGGERQAQTLFDRFFPGSYAQPGRPGVRRWAGVYATERPDGAGEGDGERAGDGDADGGGGRLLAVAADAWSAAGCGLLAGVVAHPRARGRGLGAAVSAFVIDALVRRYGRAALMVDADNTPAVRAYERAGMRARLFGAAGRAG
ncbi:GNAT family N-acetyltransferase [Streptomyces mexicanus]|uniref:GNAT family N-acetyltransferase n=1 Tax=Streptomyces mexicanus TaxID=178566 RepID=UPI001F1589A7|nr:GNAT family N-acetyltransferase [Streptomyces mexicanus]